MAFKDEDIFEVMLSEQTRGHRLDDWAGMSFVPKSETHLAKRYYRERRAASVVFDLSIMCQSPVCDVRRGRLCACDPRVPLSDLPRLQ